MDTHTFIFPAIRCREGSAWHAWMREGAIFAHNNPGVCFSSSKIAAHEFASKNSLVGRGPEYESRLSAFMEGVKNVGLLREIYT